MSFLICWLLALSIGKVVFVMESPRSFKAPICFERLCCVNVVECWTALRVVKLHPTDVLGERRGAVTQRRVCWFIPRCYSYLDFGKRWALASRETLEVTLLALWEYGQTLSWVCNSMIEFMLILFAAGIWSVQRVVRISRELFLLFPLSSCCSPKSLEHTFAGPHEWRTDLWLIPAFHCFYCFCGIVPENWVSLK